MVLWECQQFKYSGILISNMDLHMINPKLSGTVLQLSGNKYVREG